MAGNAQAHAPGKIDPLTDLRDMLPKTSGPLHSKYIQAVLFFIYLFVCLFFVCFFVCFLIIQTFFN
jgi:hypothetical protein